MNIQKLRDMNLHAVADELERLREFKSEVENQGPVIRISGGRVVDFNPNYGGSVSEGAFYAKPVPAEQVPDAIQLLQRVAASTTDKPASAVPDDHEAIDTARLRKGFGTAKGKAEQLAAYHAALNSCCDEIDCLRSKVAATPSHSQQSSLTDDQILILSTCHMGEVFAESYCNDIIKFGRAIEAAVLGRPDHDSEQGVES